MIRALLILIVFFISACQSKSDYLIRVTDSGTNKTGYINTKGDTIIPPGRYLYCYTDTFKNYAIVSKPYAGLVGINRQETVLYNVFVFDNGPDYLSEGYFRIIKNKKMGYADARGNIAIAPIYACALPFEKGIAKVSMACKVVPDGDEHWYWESENWFYIDTKGNRVK